VAITTGRTIKVGGTSTAFSNEACTKLTANTVYQITDASKRVWDPASLVTVQVDADGAGAGGYVTAAAGTYTIDFLFGRITFASDQGASALVRVSGSYLPAVAVAKVRECSLTVSRDAVDSSTHDSAGYREKTPTLIDVSGSFTSFELAQYDHDAGGGTVKFMSLLTSGAPFLYEERGDASGQYFRAWVVATGLEQNGAVGDLNSLTVNFAGAAQRGLGTSGQTTAGCGWGT
jgi:hypothetical protein